MGGVPARIAMGDGLALGVAAENFSGVRRVEEHIAALPTSGMAADGGRGRT